MMTPDQLFPQGQLFDITTNEPKLYKDVRYVGEAVLYGKPLLVFETVDGIAQRVNPSYMVSYNDAIPVDVEEEVPLNENEDDERNTHE